MERDDLQHVEQLRRTAERAEAAPWVDLPPTPAWYPPATGLWAAAMTAVLVALDGPVGFAAVAALTAVELGFLVWCRRCRGTLPNGAMPAEMRAVATVSTVLLVVLVTVLFALAHLFATWVPVAVALAAVTTLTTWHERASADGAARVRARLG